MQKKVILNTSFKTVVLIALSDKINNAVKCNLTELTTRSTSFDQRGQWFVIYAHVQGFLMLLRHRAL